MFGTTSSTENGTQTSTTQSTSLLSANSGNLTVLAGADNQYTGSGQAICSARELTCRPNKLHLQGNAVTLDAISNQDNNQYHQETKSFTIGSQLSGSVGSVITSIYDAAQAARNTSNDRLQGALALKAGYDAYKLANGGVGTALKAEAR
jgi:filamentous hemagglutinin